MNERDNQCISHYGRLRNWGYHRDYCWNNHTVNSYSDLEILP